MMRANRPWYSETRKPKSKKQKIITRTIIIGLIVALAVSIITRVANEWDRQERLSQKAAHNNYDTSKNDIGNGDQEEFVDKTTREYLEDSMKDYDILYHDFKMIYAVGNSNMGDDLQALSDRIENARYDLEQGDTTDNEFPNSYTIQFKAVDDLQNATKSAIDAWYWTSKAQLNESLARVDYYLAKSYEESRSAISYLDRNE